jgi:hypothetical protein
LTKFTFRISVLVKILQKNKTDRTEIEIIKIEEGRGRERGNNGEERERN